MKHISFVLLSALVLSGCYLKVGQEPMMNENTAMIGEQNIVLLRFNMRKGSKGGSIVHKLTFTEEQSDTLGNVTQFTLWKDTNADLNVDTIVPATVTMLDDPIAAVQFTELNGEDGIAVSDEVMYEIHADVAQTLASNNTLQLRFADELPKYIDGTRANGDALNGFNCTSCDIGVTTDTATLWTFGSTGNLYIDQETAMPNRQLLGSTTALPIMDMTMEAEFESVHIVGLQISVGGVGAAIDNAISTIDIHQDDNATPVASATRGACPGGSPASLYCVVIPANDLTVPFGQQIHLTFAPHIQSDQLGSISGDEIFLSLAASGGIDAVGVTSQQSFVPNNADGTAEGEYFIGTTDASSINTELIGPTHDIVHAKITSIDNADNSPDGSPVPNGTDVLLGAFAFTAAAHTNTLNGANDAVLDNIIFSVFTENGTAENFTLRNTANGATVENCQLLATQSSSNGMTTSFVECADLVASPMQTAIGSDESIELALHGDTSSATPTMLYAALQDFGVRTETYGVTDSHIEWIDTDSSTTQTFAWMDIENNPSSVYSRCYGECTLAYGAGIYGDGAYGSGFAEESDGNLLMVAGGLTDLSIANASPDADGTAIPVGYDRAIGQFRFTNEGEEEVLLDSMTFTVNTENVTLGIGDQTNLSETDFTIHNKENPNVKIPCVQIGQDENMLTITCTNIEASPVNSRIETYATFVLETDVMNPQQSSTQNSLLQVVLTHIEELSSSEEILEPAIQSTRYVQ